MGICRGNNFRIFFPEPRSREFSRQDLGEKRGEELNSRAKLVSESESASKLPDAGYLAPDAVTWIDSNVKVTLWKQNGGVSE